MTEANESLGLSASEHILRIYEHTHALPSSTTRWSTPHRSRRTRWPATRPRGAEPIVADIERVEALGVRCIAGDFASEDGVVRHAAQVIGALLALGRTGFPSRYQRG